MKTTKISIVIFSTLALCAGGNASAQVSKTTTPAASSQASKVATPVDPKVKAAEEARSTVLKRGEELEKSTKELLRVIQEMDETLPKQKVAWDGLKSHMALLKKVGNDVKQNQDRFNRDFQLYRTALEKAATSFKELVAMYKKYAEKEDDSFFQEQYFDMADAAQKFSEATRKKHDAIDAIHAEVTQKLRFVDKSLAWLDRFSQFATLYDPVIDKGAEVERILEELNAYISYFEQSIRTFKDFSKKVLDTTGESSNSSEQQKERSKPVLGPQALRPDTSPVVTETADTGNPSSRSNVRPVASRPASEGQAVPKPSEAAVRSAPTLVDLQRSNPDPTSLYWAKKRAGIP